MVSYEGWSGRVTDAFPDKVGDFETSANAGPCHVIVGKAPWALRI
jgi:hypothetical protein